MSDWPDIVDEPLEFLIGPNMLPVGQINLLGGSPHAGKSLIFAQLINSFLSGESFLDGLTFTVLKPKEIGIILTDRPWADNSYWIKRLGINVPHYSIADDPFDVLASYPKGGHKVFEYCLDQLPATVKMVFVDVATTVLFGPNIWDQGTLYREMISMLRILKRRGLGFLGTCYGSKQTKSYADQTTSPIDRIVGAQSVRGSVSTALFLPKLDEERGEDDKSANADHQVLHWLSRHTGPRKFALVRDSEGFFVERELITPKFTNQNMETYSRVLAFVPEDGIRRADLRNAVIQGIQCSRRSAQRYLSEMLHGGLLHISGDTVTASMQPTLN